jgi:hypothetical protein
MPYSAPQPDVKSTLSFESLFAFWKKLEDSADAGTAALARHVGTLDHDHPPFEGPDADALFSVLFPAGTRETDIGAIIQPFVFGPLYKTPRFAEMMSKTPHGPGTKVKDRHDALMMVYRFALKSAYGLDLGPMPAMKLEIPFDGLPRYFMAQVDLSHCRVETAAGLPPLTDDLRLRLLEASNDPGQLSQLVPLSLFTIHGFAILRAVDVTASEALSQLKLLLIENETIADPVLYKQIQDHIRALLGKPDVDLFVAAFRDDKVLMLHEDLLAGDNCFLMGSEQSSMDDYKNTAFGRSYEENRPMAFPRLEAGTDAELNKLHEMGVRSLITSPLTIGDRHVGLAVLSSPAPLRLHPGDLDALDEALPLLALGVRRSMDELNARVQRLIQKNFTSIHPAVAWKFQREATEAMLVRSGTLGEVVFENVWPLYAVSDIRNSSTHRSQAILSDLIDQLEQGHAIVSAAKASLTLPLLDELEWRIRGQRELLGDGLNAGDEISVLNFLRRELEPTFDELEKAGPAVKALIDRYRANIHHEARSVYRRRKDFDDSIRNLNRAVVELLDREQAEAQLQFPHYFDKNTTDGVDQSIYLGPSLMPDGRWDPLYLKNLKLWQFLSLGKIARLAEDLKATLPVPLELTHLIMVQDLPITIRFRADEKRFAVDGAYNVRYEIMKKRIDKAVVKATGERLTQPGMIAIVYSQSEEVRDYRQFIEYMTAQGWLEDGIEELDLEDLQGVHGLKALRVAVKLPRAAAPKTVTRRARARS